MPQAASALHRRRALQRLTKVLEALDSSREMIVADDGSKDGTYGLDVELHGRDPRVKVLHLSRNFGHELALSAGPKT